MTNGYVSHKNKHIGIRNPYTCIFFFSLHICLLTHEEVCGSTCMSPPLKMNGLCIHTDTCVYIFFIEACLYDSSVTGPSVHTLHDSACLSAPLKWSCLVRQTVKGWGRALSRNAALCIVCKNKPSGQRYLKRIYIKQLQKQASVCGLVMQQRPHHKSESDHLSGRGNKEIRGEEPSLGPSLMPPPKYEEPATVEGKTEDFLSVEGDPPADRPKWGGIILQ